MKKRTFAIISAITLAGCYMHGWRVISLEEVPSSHRPWQVYLSASYADKHLSEETSYNQQDSNWLSQLAGQ